MPNNLKSINDQISSIRQTSIGNPVRTFGNAMQLKVKQALAPINQAAIAAAKIRMQIQQRLIQGIETAKKLVETGMMVFQLVTNPVGFSTKEVIKKVKKKIKEKIAEAVNGVVQQLKDAVSTLIGTISDTITEAVDTIANSAEIFNEAIVGIGKDVAETIKNVREVVNYKNIEEAEVGLISGSASQSLKDNLQNFSNRVIRDINVDPDFKDSVMTELGTTFTNEIASETSTFVSPVMTQKAELDSIKTIDKKPFNRPNLSFFNNEKEVQARPVYDPEIQNYVKNKIDVSYSEFENFRGRFRKFKLLKDKELLSLSQITDENYEVVSLDPLDETEFYDFMAGGGLPDRFSNLDNVLDINYNDVFGSRDQYAILLCLIKNNFSIQDDRFPEISGNRRTYIEILKNAGIIINSSDVTVLEPGSEENLGVSNTWSFITVDGNKYNVRYNSPKLEDYQVSSNGIV